MPLRKNNTRGFHRRLYAGELTTVTLLKRGYDQKQGTVVSHLLFNCRRSKIYVSGEPIQENESSGSRTRWHIPREELDRVGVADICAADRIVEDTTSPTHTNYWQPESTTTIEVKLFENFVVFDALQINPPKVPQ